MKWSKRRRQVNRRHPLNTWTDTWVQRMSSFGILSSVVPPLCPYVFEWSHARRVICQWSRTQGENIAFDTRHKHSHNPRYILFYLLFDSLNGYCQYLCNCGLEDGHNVSIDRFFFIHFFLLFSPQIINLYLEENLFNMNEFCWFCYVFYLLFYISIEPLSIASC